VNTFFLSPSLPDISVGLVVSGVWGKHGTWQDAERKVSSTAEQKASMVTGFLPFLRNHHSFPMASPNWKQEDKRTSGYSPAGQLPGQRAEYSSEGKQITIWLSFLRLRCGNF
ncbi:hypothetical protein H1C71_015915, partial [Ictidomys tridecemlineatus]